VEEEPISVQPANHSYQMQIKELKLKNFRNHTNKSIELDSKLTLLIGPNGAGKTNILESIFVLATGKSQRARYDKDLINYDKNFATISASITNQDDDYSLELQVIKSEGDTNFSSKKAKVNKVVKSITGFAGIFNAVIFIPEDISIITGSPAERRRFLDLILSQSDKNYKRNLSAFIKAVRQRNKVLEMINEERRGYDQLPFWNEQIYTYGNAIHEKRVAFINFANENISKLIHELDSPKATAEIKYKQNKVTTERIESYRDKEIAAKSTLLGPHRDDFEIDFNGHNVAEFGSRGQQRTILISLKLLEIGFIEKTKGERPVLLLDDIFSELDEKHRQAILTLIDKQQTVISSAEPENILGVKIGTTINL
jgi:DNA replication and repair protein RecF